MTAGKVAIVTGAARGIGAAICDTLTADGFRVAGLDVQVPDRPAAHGAPAGPWLLHCDVSEQDQVDAAVATVLHRFGRVDVLVNNAGILHVHAVHDTPREVWDRTLAVNVTGTYLVSKACIPLLRAAGGGSIVNVSSVHAVATVPRAAAYAASKGAVLALSRQMALDYYDDGIRVNALVVGGVDTEMSTVHGSGMARDGVQVATATGAIGRTAQPREIAHVVSFLVSDKAAFITGAPVIVDGGMLARLV